MTWFSFFFFLSGLCSIVYELVWLRLAMAKFGVTTALVSIVLSVFMAGLGAGSWVAGTLLRRHGERIKFPPLRIYALCELLIGISALLVPLQLSLGARFLTRVAGHVAISSGSYYLLSAGWLVLVLVPWCACMGATIPLGMFAIRREWRDESPRSFSLLYLTNVLGAVAGCCVAPPLVELFGFHGTLRIGAMLNGLIFVAAFVLTLSARMGPSTALPVGAASAASPTIAEPTLLLLLFTTGLTTMGLEVVWIRLFTVFVGPLVYSFAKILAAYLVATFVGSQLYRVWSRHRRERESSLWWVSLAFFSLLPLLTADPRLSLNVNLRVFLGIFPFAAVVGFLTPMLVDRWSGGDPDRAGRAYAINVVGCILGPLVTGFLLLPHVGEHTSMLLLALPWFGMTFLSGRREERRGLIYAASAGLLIAAVTLVVFTKDYEVLYPGSVIVRDSTATVVASGKGMEKRLLVNGIGMTVLTQETKMMSHLTLSFLNHPPQNALIICFGMGTTFRSALSWGIPATAVELVPSVPKVFTYYYADAAQILASPSAHVVVDDGRRFLDRSPEKFDAIIVDGPPPISAAGSSLLYSREFYLLAQEHLTPGGIVQQWVSHGDAADRASITRAMQGVFPYVRVFESVFVGHGLHFFGSMQPIPKRTGAELLARMPAGAVKDMMEWIPQEVPAKELDLALSKEISPEELIALAPNAPQLQDDRPINEYDWLRTLFPRLINARGARVTEMKTDHK